MVVLAVEQVDNTGDFRPLVDFVLREVLEVVPDQVDGPRLVWIEPTWFDHCSATMLSFDMLPDMPACLLLPSISSRPLALLLSLPLEPKAHLTTRHLALEGARGLTISPSQCSKAAQSMEAQAGCTFEQNGKGRNGYLSMQLYSTVRGSNAGESNGE